MNSKYKFPPRSKRIRSLVILFVMFLTLNQIVAQAPGGFNYQASLKDSDGNLLASKKINLTITIHVGSPQGGPVFSQTKSLVTSSSGVVSFPVGGGNTFKVIDWSKGPYFLEVEFEGPDGHVNLGSTQLMSFPYALYAEKSGSGSGGGTLDHEWIGTALRLEKPDGSYGELIELKGDPGKGIKVVGNLDTADDLDPNYEGDPGDLFLEQKEGNGYI